MFIDKFTEILFVCKTRIYYLCIIPCITVVLLGIDASGNK